MANKKERTKKALEAIRKYALQKNWGGKNKSKRVEHVSGRGLMCKKEYATVYPYERRHKKTSPQYYKVKKHCRKN